MRQGHLPYGYRIVNGKAVIDEEKAGRVRGIYKAYLAGAGYIDAARFAGLEMHHGSVRKLMQNKHYLGDGFYPAIIDRETFAAAEKERLRRAEYLGRKYEKKPQTDRPVPTQFCIGTVIQKYKDPFKQAAYTYSLIESEE